MNPHWAGAEDQWPLGSGQCEARSIWNEGYVGQRNDLMRAKMISISEVPSWQHC